MSFAQYQEEVDFANSYNPADKFAGFDRGDLGRADFGACDVGTRVIGRMTSTQQPTKPTYDELVAALKQIRFRVHGTSYRMGTDVHAVVQPLLDRLAQPSDDVAASIARFAAVNK